MAWVRIDDGFADHPKVADVGPLGMAYQIAALCYCNKYLTDGYLPASVSLRLCYLEGLAEPEEVIARLVDAGMWKEVEGGYLIHDYLEYQPSKAQVEAAQEQRREAGRRGGQARAKRTAKRAASEPPSGSPSENEAKLNPNPKPKPLIEDEEDIRAGAHEEIGGSQPIESDDTEWTYLFKQVFDGNINDLIRDEVAEACDTLGVELVKEAMRRSLRQASQKPRAYLAKVLKQWIVDGIDTFDKLEIADKEHEKRKGRNARAAPRRQPRESAAERLLRLEGAI